MYHNELSLNANDTVKLPYKKIGEYYIEDLGDIKTNLGYRIFKRLFDFLFSAMSLCLMILPMIVISVIIKCTSEGPILHKQERLGYNGKKFTIIKFRSMYVDAEKYGAQWSMGDNDDRITRFGHFLRKTRLDELPQFFSILKNDMSLIGPRPEREVFYNEFETYIHGFSERLKVKPGMTGLAQVYGGYDLKPEEKIIYDIEYIKKQSVMLDLKILFKTISVVITGSGAK